MPVPYQKHGRRHAADGEDPIPGVGAAAAMWPMSYNNVLAYDSFKLIGADGEASPYWSSAVTKDANYLGGYYVENSTDSAQFLRYFRLGPKGSIWCINFLADKGSDAGILTFSWQTISEATSASGNGYSDDGAGMVGGAGDRGAITYYTTDSNTVDLYAAAPALHTEYDLRSVFRIGGDDGDAITGNATLFDADDAAKSFDGGSGIWVLSVEINGKNASSSAYRCRLEGGGFWLRRLTSDLLPMA